MEILFRKDDEEFELVESDSFLAFEDPESALELLETVAGDPLNMLVAHGIWEEELGPVARSPWERRRNLRHLASLVAQGRIQILRRAPEPPEPVAEPEEAAPTPQSPAKTKDRRPRNLYVRLDIDPKDVATHDDKIILTGSDGYRCEKTVKDDQVPGDDYVDLLFTGLYEGERYTLQVLETPDGSPYSIFQDVPYEELAEVSPDPTPEDKDSGTSDEPAPEEGDREVE